MATVFTKIIEGEIPGRFVWRDDRAVVFLTIAPITPGHVLVVPIEEVDHWVDLDPELAAHLMRVAREVGRAQMRVFQPRRVGMIIAGLEVPHCHLHLVPINVEAELSFSRADHDPDPAALDAAAGRLRDALRDLGHAERVDGVS
ncbi:MAG: HIT family protein [Acidimicrobiales bacterium]|jgi:diadenosine tetraphosphate (Ap4A) HIT family hydrolase